MLLIFLCTLCFSKFFTQVLYHPYMLHCRMFALTIYHRYFAKIFLISCDFQWRIKDNIHTYPLAENIQYILLGLTTQYITFAYTPAWLTVSCTFYVSFDIQYTVIKRWIHFHIWHVYFLMPLSHWMKTKLRQHYYENIWENAKYDKLSKVTGEVHYE